MNDNTAVLLGEEYINQNQAEIENRINFSAFSVYLIIGLLRATNLDFPHWSLVAQVLQFAMLFLILFVVFLEVINRKIRLKPIPLAFLAIGLVNALITRHTLILSFAIFFFGFSNCRFEKLIKGYLIVLGMTFFVIEVLAFLDIIPMAYSSRTDVLRYNMGFRTSTLAPAIFFFFALGLVYLLQERIPVFVLLALLLGSFLLYQLTDTRTGFFLTVLLVFLAYLYRFESIRSFSKKLFSMKWMKFLCIFFPVFILLFDFMLIGYYSTFTSLAFRLNRLLSTRLSLSLNLIKTYGFHLFGKKIPSIVNGEYYQSDICYIYYGLNYGILALVMTLYLHIKTIQYGLKRNDVWLVVSILFVVLDGIFEPYVLDYKYQIFTMAISPSLLAYQSRIKVYECSERLLEEYNL